MGLFLSSEVLAAAYDYLAVTQPFCEWGLPHSEDVKFKVMVMPRDFGDWYYDGKRHFIRVSKTRVETTSTLITTMAHEMIHVHEMEVGTCSRADHNVAFNKFADLVCVIHGFDRGLF